MARKKGERGILFQTARKHPKLTTLLVGGTAAFLIGSATTGGEEAPMPAQQPPAPGAQPGGQGGQAAANPNGPPPFDPAAGKYNKEHLRGQVKCNVAVTRGAGSLALAPALNKNLQGVWYTYALSSRNGTIRGYGTNVADPTNIRGGKASSLNVQAHYPYGNTTNVSDCQISGALAAPAPGEMPVPLQGGEAVLAFAAVAPLEQTE